MQPDSLAGRSKEILFAVIRTHISTGEPVGSRTVSRQWKESLSPASIRNIMLLLEEEGYLEQPHISAGRVPTEKAYRFYASQFDASEPPSKPDQELILNYLGDLSSMNEDEILENTSRVLSLVSNNLGVVILQAAGTAVLEHIHFVALEDRRILVVLVSPGSPVQHRILRAGLPLSQPELDAAAEYLNTHFRGWELEKIRQELTVWLAEQRSTYNRLVESLRQLNDHGILLQHPLTDVFLEGASNMIGRPELADQTSLRELIRALEEKENLVRLIAECIHEDHAPLQVIIGLPGKPSLLRHFSLVGSGLEWSHGMMGRMAILGPSRMPYDRAIRALGYIGRLLRSQRVN